MSAGKIYHRLRQTARQLKHKFSPGAIILMYHRVAEYGSDPWSLCVTPEHFAEHLDVLQRHKYPIHLQELTKTLSDRRPIQRSIVITFDDGYADNLYNAKPLLEKYGCPATVFVTTNGLGNATEFWWDELDRILLQPGYLPATLELNCSGKHYRWELGETTHYSKNDHLKHHYWTMEEADPTPRHFLYRSLYQVLQFVPAQEQEELINKLRVWANTGSVGRTSHRSLSPVEVVDLEAGGLIEVGAHTITHPSLSKLSISSQRDEIQHSKKELEEILGHPVRSFSYPNGSYARETISIVEETGFNCACSSVVDRVQKHSDKFLLPRVVVKDWDRETFERWLSEWLCL